MERDRGRIVDAYEHNVGSVYLCQDVNASAWPECDERGYDTITSLSLLASMHRRRAKG